MERTQDVDVLNETCFPLLENSKYANSAEKCSAKLTEKLLESGNPSDFADSSYLANRNPHLERSYGSNIVRLNSSPHSFDSSVHPQDFEERPQISKISSHELMRHAGIGRGKYRGRYSPIKELELNRVKSHHMEYNSLNVDATPNSVDFPELKVVKMVCNLEASKTADPRESVIEHDPRAGDNSHESAQTKLIDNQIKEVEMRNVRAAIDQYREPDYRRMQNGFDSNKPYKGKPYRLPRYQNSGASSVQYSRTLPHFPLPPNMKPLRTLKGNEAYYRQNDARRNQSSKPPFSTDVDKIIYSKARSNMCPEKDIAAYNSNRNYAHSYPVSKNDINSHMQFPEPYVPAHMAPFRRRSFGNKMEHVNNSNKHWSSSRIYSDSNASSIGCNRMIPVPNRSMEVKYPDNCPPPDKNVNNCTYVAKTNVCDSEALERSECSSSCDKESSRSKANCSPCSLSSKQYSVAYSNANPCIDSNSELCNSSSSITNFSPVNDQGSDSDFSHYRSSHEGSLTEKSGPYTSGQPSCDSQCEQLSSHQKSNECIFMPDQSVTTNPDTMQCSVTYNSLNCSAGAMTVTQASYADIMRTPAMGLNKASLSQAFHTVNSLPKADAPNSLVQDVLLSKDNEQLNSSSEWIISRLSQTNMNMDGIHTVNGISYQASASSHDGVHPRPIAVNLEKPSFYNSTLGVGKTLSSLVQQSSLSSPEKRMLECQLVEEHLCNILISKKAEEKLSFMSESPTALPSPGEHSNNTACANVRTDSIFSDSSSVCSSTSSIFKSESQRLAADAKGSPPVIIMRNCLPSSNVTDISFGIEMEEIIQICSDSSRNSKADSSSVSDSDLSLIKSVNIVSSEKETGLSAASNSICVNILTVGGKRFLWKDDNIDASKCNLNHIMDFLQNSWNDIAAKKDAKESPDVKYYSDE